MATGPFFSGKSFSCSGMLDSMIFCKISKISLWRCGLWGFEVTFYEIELSLYRLCVLDIQHTHTEIEVKVLSITQMVFYIFRPHTRRLSSVCVVKRVNNIIVFIRTSDPVSVPTLLPTSFSRHQKSNYFPYAI